MCKCRRVSLWGLVAVAAIAQGEVKAAPPAPKVYAFCVDVVKKVRHPRVGFNFNLCHWLKVEGNKDYRPLLRANAGKLFCVTICGAQVGAQTWTNGLIQPLDRGDFDNRALLAALREIGYQGPVGIMCYGIPGDTHEYLQRSMKTWKIWTAQP